MKTSETAQQLGISRQTLNYWRRTGLLSSRGQELSFTDLVKARFISTCRGQGVSLQNIRRTVGQLSCRGTRSGLRNSSQNHPKDHPEDWHCRIALYGSDWLLERDGDELYDSVSGQCFLPYGYEYNRQGRLLPFTKRGKKGIYQGQGEDQREVAALEALFERFFCSGNMKRAEVVLREIVRKKPDHTAALVELGNMAFTKGNYSVALRYYEQALEQNPDCVEAHYNSANIHFRERHYAAAIRIYYRCLELDPQFAMAYYNLGLLFFKLQRYSETIELLTTYCDLEPDSVWVEKAANFVKKARSFMQRRE